jgi:hypothetical protein
MRTFTKRPITRGWFIAELVILNGLLVIIVPVTLLSMILAAGFVRVILEVALLAGVMVLVDFSLQSRAIARRLRTLGDSTSKGWLVPYLGFVMWPISILVVTLYIVSIERGQKAVG